MYHIYGGVYKNTSSPPNECCEWVRIGNLITCLIARWYSLLPKFVCGTIKPILKCCGDVSSFFEWWSVNLCRSPLTRFGPRSPMVMPDDPDDDCDRHAKVVAIIDTKANKMYDVFIITPSPDENCRHTSKLQSFSFSLCCVTIVETTQRTHSSWKFSLCLTKLFTIRNKSHFHSSLSPVFSSVTSIEV